MSSKSYDDSLDGAAEQSLRRLGARDPDKGARIAGHLDRLLKSRGRDPLSIVVSRDRRVTGFVPYPQAIVDEGEAVALVIIDHRRRFVRIREIYDPREDFDLEEELEYARDFFLSTL